MKQYNNMICILDRDTIAYISGGYAYWRIVHRPDNLVIGDGDDRVLFLMKKNEPIEDAAQRLADMTGWRYDYEN